MPEQTVWRYDAQRQPRWIRCEAGMPKVGEQVLIWREDFHRPTAAYMRGDGTFGLGTAVYRFVTHWMPMPPPPANLNFM